MWKIKVMNVFLLMSIGLIRVPYVHSNQVHHLCESAKSCVVDNFKNNDTFEFNSNTYINPLIDLTFNNSEFATIPSQILIELPKLETLDVSSCGILQVRRNSLTSPHLNKLNLSKNKISQLPALGFNGANNLRQLNLSYNQIEHVDRDAFKKLNKIKEIDLSYNKIKTLTIKILPHNFNELNLNNNQLEFLDIDSNIRVLQLDNNALRSETVFINSSNLTVLSVKNNSLRNVRTIKHLSNLSYLDLSLNPLENISVDFDVFPYLNNLILKSINLKHLPSISKLINLESLDISGNHLNFIDFNTLSQLDKLKHLKINNNNLSSIALDELDYLLPNLQSIDISANNWLCSDLIGALTKLEQLEITIIVEDENFIMSGLNIHGIRCTNISDGAKPIAIPSDNVIEINQTLYAIGGDVIQNSILINRITVDLAKFDKRILDLEKIVDLAKKWFWALLLFIVMIIVAVIKIIQIKIKSNIQLNALQQQLISSNI